MAERGTIKCGDDVVDSITGLTGVVIAVTTWLNGCVRVMVQPRELHEGKPVEGCNFDIEQVDLVRKGPMALADPSGGPHDAPARHPAPVR